MKSFYWKNSWNWMILRNFSLFQLIKASNKIINISSTRVIPYVFEKKLISRNFCRNVKFRNFLTSCDHRTFLPLRFYVKSNLGTMKTLIWPFWPFFRNLTFSKNGIFAKNHNSTSPKLVKQQFFAFWSQLKLISQVIRVTR